MPTIVDNNLEVSLKLFVVLSKAYKTIMDRAVKDMKKYALSASEFMILEVVYNKEKIPLQQIGDKILVTSGSMTYNIDKLEKRGLLKRIPSADDRRVIYAQLTASGKELFGNIYPMHEEAVHSIMNGLTSDEKGHVTELLKKLGKGAEGGLSQKRSEIEANLQPIEVRDLNVT